MTPTEIYVQEACEVGLRTKHLAARVEHYMKHKKVSDLRRANALLAVADRQLKRLTGR